MVISNKFIHKIMFVCRKSFGHGQRLGWIHIFQFSVGWVGLSSKRHVYLYFHINCITNKIVQYSVSQPIYRPTSHTPVSGIVARTWPACLLFTYAITY